MTLLLIDFDFSSIYKADSGGSWTFSFQEFAYDAKFWYVCKSIHMDRFAHVSIFAYMQIFAHVCKSVHVKAA